MGVPGNANTLLLKSAAAGGAYEISRSLRFNAGDSAYLNRTPASAGNRKTWTWAGWVKRSGFGGNRTIFGTDFLGASYCNLYFDGNNTFFLENYSGSYQARLQTTQVFRDPSAWYHIVVAVDTTQATAANRVKIYVNGSEVTAFAIATYPSQNTDLLINNNQYHEISNSSSTYAFNGYLADIHFIDGQALDPSSFTTTDLTTGQLIPKAYTGSYGTNGFRLAFDSYATTAALGTDTSGNGNTWTVNNLSVTAGSGNDSLVDTPTSYGTDTGVGGSVRGNYCTWNPLSSSLGTRTISNGNLDTSNSGNGNTYSTFELSSGKWYFEATLTAISGSTASTIIGLTASAASRSSDNAQNLTPNACYVADGNKIVDASSSGYGASFTANDVIGVALDIDGGSVTFYKNGSSQGAISKTFTGAGKGSWAIFTVAAGGSASNSWSLNAGARAFAYTAPSGFKALVDTNLPTPAVAKPNTLMDVVLYTGNGSTQSITGLAFSPDLVWIKCRSAANGHALTDVVRGNSQRLFSELTDAEDSTASLTSFDSNGFSVSTVGGSTGRTNLSSTTYVSWCWDAGTSTVTNTAGSITSQVRANASAGFSVVTWTGTGSAATVGHGLGIAPHMAIIKRRDASGWDWPVWHNKLTSSTYNIFLNSTNAEANRSDIWSAAPTSALLNLGNSGQVNGSSGTYVGYIFAPVSGYSSFGSYTGNGSADGPFVYTGFRPRWVLFKCSSTTSAWNLTDTARQTYNVQQTWLQPNTSDAEYTGGSSEMDILSNGFKLRNSNSPFNTNGATYIYAAFAESPFQFSRAR